MIQQQDVPLVSLVLLGELVGTVPLALSVLWLYRRSPAIPHVWPLAVSYLWILGIAIVRTSLQQITMPILQWHVACAFGLGDAGLLVLLARSFPGKPKEVKP